MRARTPAGVALALTRLDTLIVAERRYALAGGLPFGEDALARLAPDPRLALHLALPDGDAALSAEETVVRELVASVKACLSCSVLASA